MKFFGWGRKKDPPPIQPAYQEVKDSDAAKSIQSPGAADQYGSVPLVGQEDQPQMTPSQRVVLRALPSADFFGEAVVDLDSETWEERLQETIRFVFSHEPEGLLAIGTFALDQLAGVAHIDGRQKPPAAKDHSVNPRRSSFSSVQVVIHEIRSSDDEIESKHSMQRRTIAACKRKESYSVLGDHDASSSGVHCQGLSVGSTKSATAKNHPSCTGSPNASASHEAEIKPRGETRGRADPSTTLDHDQFDSEDFYSPGVCGLFASRSRRTQKDGGIGGKEKRKKAPEKRKKPPEKRKGINDSCEQLKRADSTTGSLGAQLGRLWRSACTGSNVSAKVSPEKKPISCPPADHRAESQAQGPPCIANVDEGGAGAPGVPKSSQASEVGEQRKRRGHSFGKGWTCAHNGNWIRTDSEFVVLEM